jgi:hypothetical protein
MNDRARDPRRFLDTNDTPAVLRDALAAARARAPNAATLAQLAARLPLPGGPPPGGGPSGGAPLAAPAAAPSTFSGAVIGAALGLLAVGGSFVWQALPAPPARPPERATVTVPPRLASTPSSPAPSPSAPAVSATSAPAARPIERPTPAPETSADRVAPAPGPEAPVVSLTVPGPGSDAPVAVVADAETEAQFLDRARAALGTTPGQALVLTDEHARRFPSGALGQEREVVAIQALLRLGREGEARGRAQRFLAAFPGTVHRRRIEALIAP